MLGCVKMQTGCSALMRMQVGPRRPLVAAHTAFSRRDKSSMRRDRIEGDGYPRTSGTGKEARMENQYVQDVLLEESTSVKHWMDAGGVFYICGSSAMGNAVLGALEKILKVDRA